MKARGLRKDFDNMNATLIALVLPNDGSLEKFQNPWVQQLVKASPGEAELRKVGVITASLGNYHLLVMTQKFYESWVEQGYRNVMRKTTQALASQMLEKQWLYNFFEADIRQGLVDSVASGVEILLSNIPECIPGTEKTTVSEAHLTIEDGVEYTPQALDYALEILKRDQIIGDSTLTITKP